MGTQDEKRLGADLSQGIPATSVAEGQMVGGHVDGKPVLVARAGGKLFAIGAKCTHYGGPLAKGLVVDDTVRCPWHHACFSLKTGEALHAPAFGPIGCWSVELRDSKVFVRRKLEPRPA